MKKIVPYKSYKYALAALDNGGRFYNILTKANDGDISSAELAKAAGIISGKQHMILYLEMALFELEQDKRERVLSHLSRDLKHYHANHLPFIASPHAAKSKGTVTQAAIITGIPKQIDSKTEFSGFIMVPIMTGKTMTFTMIPIYEQYDVYELTDEASSEHFIIAHARGRKKLTERRTRCGGILKELKSEKREEGPSDLFLEMLYYTY